MPVLCASFAALELCKLARMLREYLEYIKQEGRLASVGFRKRRSGMISNTKGQSRSSQLLPGRSEYVAKGRGQYRAELKYAPDQPLHFSGARDAVPALPGFLPPCSALRSLGRLESITMQDISPCTPLGMGFYSYYGIPPLRIAGGF